MALLFVIGFVAVIFFILCAAFHQAAERERRLRAIQLADIDNMGGIAFERYACRLLEHRGFGASVTRASGDLGVDIVACRSGRKYAVQVKRQSKGVSRRAVSDAVAGKQHYGCNHAMVITNNYFTRGAKELARSTGCELIDRDSLAQWALDFQRDNGEALTGLSRDADDLDGKLRSWSSRQEPVREQQSIEAKTASLPTEPGKAAAPADVCERIKIQAAKTHPADYSTQLFVIDQQIVAYKELQERERRPSIPADVFERIKENAGKDHPWDYSTQRFVLDQQLAAYDQTEKYQCPGEVLWSDFVEIRKTAAKDHPYDYSTQLYVIDQQVDAYLCVRTR